MAVRRMPPVHYIRPNESCRIPRIHIVLDSEAFIKQTPTGEEHTFRCAVTSCDQLRSNSDKWKETEYGYHESARDTWLWITQRCAKRKRTIVVAHNAGYDLRITQALDCLDELGWRVKTLSLSPGATWGIWTNETATLVVVDSMTWLPTALWRLGLLLGRPKEKLPDAQADTALWRNRCRTDVEILRSAWLRIIDWLRTNDAGNWRPTGAGTAWSYWRHKHYTHPVLVHDQEDVRNAERRAAWTGRAEAWRVGDQGSGPWIEWDMQAAYARIAQDCDLPVKLIGEVQISTWEQFLHLSKRYRILAECSISTQTPTVPASHNNGIIWPIGKFDSTLWDAEVKLCREHSGQIELGQCWLYVKKPALKQWATWIIEKINEPTDSCDPIVQSMLKHWSRALIGRFGSSYSSWEEFAQSFNPDLRLSSVRFPDDDSNRRMLTVGTNIFIEGDRVDAWDASPAIMSFVMAEARVRLWHIAVAAGLDHVLYMDTDSVIVDSVGSQRLDAANIDGLRIKGRWDSIEILATRRIITDGELRAAGIPKNAFQRGDGLWSAEVWQQMAGSLREGNGGSVSIKRKTLRLGTIDNRRIKVHSGKTRPILLSHEERHKDSVPLSEVPT